MIFVSDLFRLWAVATMVEPSWAAAQLANNENQQDLLTIFNDEADTGLTLH